MEHNDIFSATSNIVAEIENLMPKGSFRTVWPADSGEDLASRRRKLHEVIFIQIEQKAKKEKPDPLGGPMTTDEENFYRECARDMSNSIYSKDENMVEASEAGLEHGEDRVEQSILSISFDYAGAMLRESRKRLKNWKD